MFEVKFGVNLLYPFSNKISRSFVLYSGHKESGLIRILLSIGLGGPGWARGLYMDRKAERPSTASLLQ